MSNLDSMKNVRIGEVLINQGYLTQGQLEQALEVQRDDHSKRLGDLLVEMGFVTEQQKLDALSRRLDIPLVDIDSYPVNIDAVSLLPRELAEKYTLIALDKKDGELTLAVNDPLNFFAIEEVRQAVKLPVALGLAEAGQIDKAINYYYSEVSTRQAVDAANTQITALPTGREVAADASAADAPVVKLLNSLLVRGYETGASDLHIEPFADYVNVRLRVDGAIVDYTRLSLSVLAPLIARVKIMADLNIAEKRKPQDGHFRLRDEEMDLNIRVSLVPTVYGEKAVLRFLSTNSRIDYSDSFGMRRADHEKALRALDSPHGIIYLTGPTGSGKTTTLYMMLEALAARQVNITTIEDPVERNIDRVNQMQVNPAAGLTFENGLRSILRQDPDIIMVGETRDSETASISVRSAITGHLVLSTLHTNDAVSTVVRLRDMGIPSYLIANSLVAVVAQRLVRKICPDCAEPYTPTEEQRAAVGEDAGTLHRGRGCIHCNHTGYRGRVAVHEILLVDREVRAMISREADSAEIFSYARRDQGMRTLRQAATALVLEGVTTVEELMKTAYYEEADA